MSIGEINLNFLLEGCKRGNRNSQRRLYEHFYGYAMNVSLRFSKNREEAVEVLNDAFLKVFAHIDRYDPAYPFKTWLRRILIHAAIDYYRKYHKIPAFLELTEAEHLSESQDGFAITISSGEDVLPVLQQLSPSYRMVFNLFVLEGYKHHEIAEMLGINVSTSRSNLVRAIAKLRELLSKKQTELIG